MRYLFAANEKIYSTQLYLLFECFSNKFLFEIDKILSLRFNVTLHWIQIDIFVVVDKYLIDS